MIIGLAERNAAHGALVQDVLKHEIVFGRARDKWGDRRGTSLNHRVTGAFFHEKNNNSQAGWENNKVSHYERHSIVRNWL